MSCGWLGRGEAAEGLQSAAEVVGSDEVGEVLAQLVVDFVMVALEVASLSVGFIRSTGPLTQGCLGLVSRWSMPFWARAYSKACARSVRRWSWRV